MAETIENLVLEHLKKIQAEQTASRERDTEILSRLSHIEISISKVIQGEGQNYSEIILNRHMVDRMNERLDRIERRLELA